MAKTGLSILALVAALSMPMAAGAQTSDQQQVVPRTQQQIEKPAQSDQPQDTQDELKVGQTKMAEVPDGLIRLQDKDTFLASDLTGATVYNSQDEAIGDVNDVIVSRDGKVDGLVVGVGGFLGIGEKDVAIEMSEIKMMETETGIKLMMDANKDELAAAPEFMSKTDIRAENAAEQSSSTQGLMVGDEQPAQNQTQTQQ
jgi:sporulation protein YlmC with PRC-barrel domain